MGIKEFVDPSKYPSVDLAYEFVKPSYDWMIARIEAINGRIQNLLTFSVTITAAVPVAVKAIFSDINFSSPFFLVSVAAFVIMAVLGIAALKTGVVALCNPQTVYDKYLHLSHWEFRQAMIFYSARHFTKNNNQINRKAKLRDFMVIALLVEILSLVLWLAL